MTITFNDDVEFSWWPYYITTCYQSDRSRWIGVGWNKKAQVVVANEIRIPTQRRK